MATEQGNRNGSLAAVLRSLRGMLLSLYKLFPAAAMSFLLLVLMLGFVLSKSEIAAQATVLVLVFIASAAIFLRTRSYTEAFLTLIVGLLPALSMTWGPSQFWVFVGGYGLLTAFCLLSASVRIAKDAESIYIQAANFARQQDRTATKESLEKLVKQAKTQVLGPIERAECVRMLVYRNFPLEQIPAALESIERFSVITGLTHGDVAAYLVILYPLASAANIGFSRLDDLFYTAMRDSAATPEEFFEAIRVTRNVVLSRRMDLPAYLTELSSLLGLGLNSEGIRQRMGLNEPTRREPGH